MFLDATANDFRGAESVKSGTVDRLFKIGDVRKCTRTRGILRPMSGISRTKRHKFARYFLGMPKVEQVTEGWLIRVNQRGAISENTVNELLTGKRYSPAFQ